MVCIRNHRIRRFALQIVEFDGRPIKSAAPFHQTTGGQQATTFNRQPVVDRQPVNRQPVQQAIGGQQATTFNRQPVVNRQAANRQPVQQATTFNRQPVVNKQAVNRQQVQQATRINNSCSILLLASSAKASIGSASSSASSSIWSALSCRNFRRRSSSCAITAG